MITTWVTVLVALHRYVAVCRPHDMERYGSLRLARVQIAAVLLLSAAFNVPRFLESRIGYVSPDNGTTWRAVAVRRAMARSNVYEDVYLVGVYQVVIYAVPLVLLVIFTHRLLRALKIAKVCLSIVLDMFKYQALIKVRVYAHRAKHRVVTILM